MLHKHNRAATGTAVVLCIKTGFTERLLLLLNSQLIKLKNAHIRCVKQLQVLEQPLLKLRGLTDHFLLCMQVMTLIQKLPVPVIAKVNGLATAAGCQLVASCDIAVASEKSQFATPGVNIGLFCSTPAVALGRSLPRKVGFPPRQSL